MKSEDEPITDDEWLLRRVWKDCFPSKGDPVFSNETFKPRYRGREIDTDGISLYREDCVNAPADILAEVPEQKQPSNGIVRVSVAFVKSIGLTVECKPEPPIKGHVVIPQLNADGYASNKAALIPKLTALAAEASKTENIVRFPEILGEGSSEKTM